MPGCSTAQFWIWERVGKLSSTGRCRGLEVAERVKELVLYESIYIDTVFSFHSVWMFILFIHALQIKQNQAYQNNCHWYNLIILCKILKFLLTTLRKYQNIVSPGCQVSTVYTLGLSSSMLLISWNMNKLLTMKMFSFLFVISFALPSLSAKLGEQCEKHSDCRQEVSFNF